MSAIRHLVLSLQQIKTNVPTFQCRFNYIFQELIWIQTKYKKEDFKFIYVIEECFT